ncbi:MAG: M48 family metallopeptidase [bacterium]|nr:M48 family metallopeptidase [bacterium]
MKKQDIFQGKKVFELEEEQRHAVITKEEGKACKHRLEKRWYRRLIELNIIMIIVVVGLVVHNMDKNKKLASKAVKQIQQEMNESSDDNATSNDDKNKLTVDDIPFEIQMLGYGFMALIVGYLGLYFYFAYYRANSLRITEKNFPEVYALIEEYSYRLGISTPKAYVIQQSGILNAFSTFIFRKQWICIHSELFEVAYREHKDMDALAFIIAHELAHIYYGHATLHYNLPIWFSSAIPIIGATASRTREYSCDRLAQRLTGSDGLDAMLVLVIDRHLYKMVDKEDYIQEMRGQRGFFLWVVNLVVDHPIMSKRVVALEEGRGSGKLY